MPIVFEDEKKKQCTAAHTFNISNKAALEDYLREKFYTAVQVFYPRVALAKCFHSKNNQSFLR